jgi:hypothetical protein
MRDTITFYQVTLAKPWTADAPGAVEEPVGRILYFGVRRFDRLHLRGGSAYLSSEVGR